MEGSHQSHQLQCLTCGEDKLKSRNEWLYHLILQRHNEAGMKTFQQWPDVVKMNVFVITGVDERRVNRSLLLDCVNLNLRTFTNVVFFQPRANICVVVADEREFHQFASVLRRDWGDQLKLKAYREISLMEWDSFFQTEANPCNVSGGASSSRKRPAEENSSDALLKRQKYPHGSENDKRNYAEVRLSSCGPATDAVLAGDNYKSGQGPSTSVYGPVTSTLETEAEMLLDFITMPDIQWRKRMQVVQDLRAVLRKPFPKCEIVPVGADFLGFNMSKEIFVVYFDSSGCTELPNSHGLSVILESDKVIQDIRSAILPELHKEEYHRRLLKVASTGPTKIVFKHVASDLACQMLLKPFKAAQTAKLCQQLYKMEARATWLMRMVAYWIMKHGNLTNSGFRDCYVICWLVYFFLMTKGVLPPIIDLQKASNMEIFDDQMNVAFYVDEQRTNMAEHELSELDPHFLRSQMQELAHEWFVYMDDIFGETNGKGINRRHSLICPRYAQLIDKRKFKVCREHFHPKGGKLGSDQKKVRRLWKANLIEIGFDESTWSKLRGLRLPDTLCIQHPLYYDENISLHFDGPFSKGFFAEIQKTRQKLDSVVAQGKPEGLLAALS